MRGSPFDDSTPDAVFRGSSDVPAEMRDVAELARAARRPGSADELVDETEMVAQIAAAVGTRAATQVGADQEGTLVHGRLRQVKVMAAAAAVVLFGGAAAAAATGTLPSGLQSSLAAGASHVGISIPDPHDAQLSASRPHVAAAHVGAPKHFVGPGMKGHPAVFGTVASVGGTSDAGTCGTAGAIGPFTVKSKKDATVITVNVDAATKFFAPSITGPTFANVCVGEFVAAVGTKTDTTVAATKVFISPRYVPEPPKERPVAFGTVASVGGTSDAGTCGTAGATGSFTVTGKKNATPITVNVDATTKFFEREVTGPTFANVCVGELVAAVGTKTDTTVAATKVFIAPKRPDKPKRPEHPELPPGAFGKVASVGGSTTAGACGTAGGTGSFTVTSKMGATTITVNVDASTKFFSPGVSAPSFANVCVGAMVGAFGTKTDANLAATKVYIAGPHFGGGDKPHNPPVAATHFGPGGRGWFGGRGVFEPRV